MTNPTTQQRWRLRRVATWYGFKTVVEGPWVSTQLEAMSVSEHQEQLAKVEAERDQDRKGFEDRLSAAGEEGCDECDERRQAAETRASALRDQLDEASSRQPELEDLASLLESDSSAETAYNVAQDLKALADVLGALPQRAIGQHDEIEALHTRAEKAEAQRDQALQTANPDKSGKYPPDNPFLRAEEAEAERDELKADIRDLADHHEREQLSDEAMATAPGQRKARVRIAMRRELVPALRALLNDPGDQGETDCNHCKGRGYAESEDFPRRLMCGFCCGTGKQVEAGVDAEPYNPNPATVPGGTYLPPDARPDSEGLPEFGEMPSAKGHPPDPRETLRKIAGLADYEYQDIIGEAGDLTVADQMRADARAALHCTGEAGVDAGRLPRNTAASVDSSLYQGGGDRSEPGGPERADVAGAAVQGGGGPETSELDERTWLLFCEYEGDGPDGWEEGWNFDVHGPRISPADEWVSVMPVAEHERRLAEAEAAPQPSYVEEGARKPDFAEQDALQNAASDIDVLSGDPTKALPQQDQESSGVGEAAKDGEAGRTRWELHLCPVHRWTTREVDGRCGDRNGDGALCGERFSVTTYVMPVGECQDRCLKGEHPE